MQRNEDYLLVAKLAGYDIEWKDFVRCYCWTRALPVYSAWNPRASTDDAMQLAADLLIDVEFDMIDGYKRIRAFSDMEGCFNVPRSKDFQDDLSRIREAIWRCAVAIARADDECPYDE